MTLRWSKPARDAKLCPFVRDDRIDTDSETSSVPLGKALDRLQNLRIHINPNAVNVGPHVQGFLIKTAATVLRYAYVLFRYAQGSHAVFNRSSQPCH